MLEAIYRRFAKRREARPVRLAFAWDWAYCHGCDREFRYDLGWAFFQSSSGGGCKSCAGKAGPAPKVCLECASTVEQALAVFATSPLDPLARRIRKVMSPDADRIYDAATEAALKERRVN